MTTTTTPWYWGRLSAFFLRLHISREIRPFAYREDATRDETLRLLTAKLREHFDRAWPPGPSPPAASPPREIGRDVPVNSAARCKS
jgi:hypothetical protein